MIRFLVSLIRFINFHVQPYRGIPREVRAARITTWPEKAVEAMSDMVNADIGGRVRLDPKRKD